MTDTPPRDADDRLTRRHYVAGIGTVGAIGLAGCAGGSGGDESSDGGSDGEGSSDGGSGDETSELEIVHWWTAGGEKDAYTRFSTASARRSRTSR
ncbi:MAG: hypothetical protein A07HR67_02328, partial [uncultured archaeon A07HR67]